MSECVYTRAECHHQGTKCSECPITELICDEFTDCLDLSYQQGKADALNIDLDTPMHFTPEQKAWVKKYISINAERQRADGAREFAEWLCRKSRFEEIDWSGIWDRDEDNKQEFFSIDEVLAKWQKEQTE